MKGFEQAQAEYESKMFAPYDYYKDDEERISDEEAYWLMVDSQIEDAKLEEELEL